MKRPSDAEDEPRGLLELERRRAQIIGLGERSFKKTYFPELQRRLAELERFRLLLEQAGEAIFLVRAGDAAIIDANRSACAFTGLAKEQLLRTSVGELWDAASAEDISRILRQRNEHERVMVGALRARGGKERPVETTFQLVSLEDGDWGVAVSRDISERKRWEQALIQAKERAEEADRAKSEFLDIASHELRTPITSARLLLLLLRKQVASANAIPVSTVDRIAHQIERLASMVNDLLDISRLERGALRLKREECDLAQIARDVVETFRLRTNHPNVVLVCPTGRTLAELDPVRIAQVLDNLLDNASKYSPPGAAIEVLLSVDRATVRVSVTDHGEGIAEADVPQLFSRFFRSKSETVRRTAGLGLGLNIAKEIVELHGGRIGVATSIGEGSSFTFELPLRPAGP